MKLSFILFFIVFENVFSASVQNEAKTKNIKHSEPADSQNKNDVEPFVNEIEMRKERNKPNVQNAPLKADMKELLDGEPLPQKSRDYVHHSDPYKYPQKYDKSLCHLTCLLISPVRNANRNEQRLIDNVKPNGPSECKGDCKGAIQWITLFLLQSSYINAARLVSEQAKNFCASSVIGSIVLDECSRREICEVTDELTNTSNDLGKLSRSLPGLKTAKKSIDDARKCLQQIVDAKSLTYDSILPILYNNTYGTPLKESQESPAEYENINLPSLDYSKSDSSGSSQ